MKARIEKDTLIVEPETDKEAKQLLDLFRGGATGHCVHGRGNMGVVLMIEQWIDPLGESEPFEDDLEEDI